MLLHVTEQSLLLSRHSSSLIWTDTGLLGDLPTCILPIHILLHVLPLNVSFQNAKNTSENIIRFLKTHSSQLSGIPPIYLHSIPRSSFLLPLQLLANCQTPQIYTIVIPNTHWFLTTTGSWLHTTQHVPSQPLRWKLQQVFFSLVFSVSNRLLHTEGVWKMFGESWTWMPCCTHVGMQNPFIFKAKVNYQLQTQFIPSQTKVVFSSPATLSRPLW